MWNYLRLFLLNLLYNLKKKLILLFDLFTYLLSQLCFKLCLLNVLYNLNNQILSILITRSYNRVMIRHNCKTYVSIIPNFIFGFWSLLAMKLRKYEYLSLHFARQDEQDGKKTERKSRNKSDQNTKNQKTKIWDNQNIKRNKNWLKKLWNVGEEHQGAEHSNAEYSSRKHHRKESHRHHRNHDHRFFSFAFLAIKIVEKKINSVLFFLVWNIEPN